MIIVIFWGGGRPNSNGYKVYDIKMAMARVALRAKATEKKEANRPNWHGHHHVGEGEGQWRRSLKEALDEHHSPRDLSLSLCRSALSHCLCLPPDAEC